MGKALPSTLSEADIVLLSASNLEQLGMNERLFDHSAITPAARANDTSDVWAVRD